MILLASNVENFLKALPMMDRAVSKLPVSMDPNQFKMA